VRNEHNETPREAALGTAIQSLRDEWRLHQKALKEFGGNTSFNRKALIQLAKIHNRMLEDSGFDGTLLPEE
jgi:hypothetical protein